MGVKNSQHLVDVMYGWPHGQILSSRTLFCTFKFILRRTNKKSKLRVAIQQPLGHVVKFRFQEVGEEEDCVIQKP